VMSAGIKVKCFNGKAYDVEVNPDTDLVSDLQARIAGLSDIAAERQTLLFKGQVLESSARISDYPISAGITISVVRRVGKAAPVSSRGASATATNSSSKSDRSDTAGTTNRLSPTPSSNVKETAASSALKESEVFARPTQTDESHRDAMPDMEAMEAMMRSLGMGGMGGMGGAGSMGGAGGMGGVGDLGSLAGMPGMTGLGGGGGGANPAAGLDKLMSQMPMMMNGLMQSPALQEYLNDPSKQEASRNAIVGNPMLKAWLESDPEFSKVVNDPDQWKKSMDAARSLFAGKESSAGELDLNEDASAGASRNVSKSETRPSAAGAVPPGINIAKLSESYGHALGQSLVNSGLGLEPDLVMKGFKSACDGQPFPMSLPEYERSMAKLQGVAAEYLEKSNLEDADHFFSEIKEEERMVIVETGKIAYEPGDVEPDSEQPVALAESTVLVIVTARLLDGRHFFTCPAADETGETVHPLTLPLATAPPALAAGIRGMKETESRMLFVHPSASDGMTEMFGDLLPPNALLIFDLQLVSANAPEEEIAAAREAAAAAMPGGKVVE
jgi:FKBP-type peptidyl-prolyl cis-trans isomerase